MVPETSRRLFGKRVGVRRGAPHRTQRQFVDVTNFGQRKRAIVHPLADRTRLGVDPLGCGGVARDL